MTTYNVARCHLKICYTETDTKNHQNPRCFLIGPSKILKVFKTLDLYAIILVYWSNKTSKICSFLIGPSKNLLFSLGQFAYSKIFLSVCTLSQLLSLTKALFYCLNKTCSFLIGPSKTCCFLIGQSKPAVFLLVEQNMGFPKRPIKNLLFFYW